MQSIALRWRRLFPLETILPRPAAIETMERRQLFAVTPAVVPSTTPLDYSSGFTGQGSALLFSAPAGGGTAAIGADGALHLNNPSNPARLDASVLSTQAFSTSGFDTTFDFVFQAGVAGPTSGEFDFRIQSPTDSTGSNNGDDVRFFSNGTGLAGLGTDTNLNASGIQLSSGHILQAHLSYDGVTFSETLIDTQTRAIFTSQVQADIPAGIGPVGYPGFTTSGTAGLSAQIFNWVYTPANAVKTAAPLAGTPIGTAGSWDGSSTIAKVFDGNTSTYFDPANGNLTNWVGLDLGKNSTISQISFAPRAGYEFRMLSGQFQVSSTADFSSDVHTIYTVTTTPTAGQLTTVNVNPGAGYRYVRYTGGLQWVNIAEMKVLGTQVPGPLIIPLGGTAYGTTTSWDGKSGFANVFDGNLNTFLDPATNDLTAYAALDLGSPKVITQISYAPRTGYEFRMKAGQFQVSSTADFSSDVHTIYTIPQSPVAGQLTKVTVPAIGAYRYVRYTGGTQWVNIAEMSVAGPDGPAALTGTAIGTPGSWDGMSGIDKAFDGNLSTFFDPANGNLSNWVGLDLGGVKTITQIQYAGRAGYEFRMVGAQIQVSSTADFSADVHTIYTITSAPASGSIVTVPVTPVSYRYIRYTGGTQWVNIAELEVDGM